MLRKLVFVLAVVVSVTSINCLVYADAYLWSIEIPPIVQSAQE